MSGFPFDRPGYQAYDKPKNNLTILAGTLVSFSALIVISGCASPYRYPCTVYAKVTLDTPRRVDEACKKLVKKNDQGYAITRHSTINGCVNYDGNHIITNGTDSNLGHEFRHLFDRECR